MCVPENRIETENQLKHLNPKNKIDVGNLSDRQLSGFLSFLTVFWLFLRRSIAVVDNPRKKVEPQRKIRPLFNPAGKSIASQNLLCRGETHIGCEEVKNILFTYNNRKTQRLRDSVFVLFPPPSSYYFVSIFYHYYQKRQRRRLFCDGEIPIHSFPFFTHRLIEIIHVPFCDKRRNQSISTKLLFYSFFFHVLTNQHTHTRQHKTAKFMWLAA